MEIKFEILPLELASVGKRGANKHGAYHGSTFSEQGYLVYMKLAIDWKSLLDNGLTDKDIGLACVDKLNQTTKRQYKSKQKYKKVYGNLTFNDIKLLQDNEGFCYIHLMFFTDEEDNKLFFKKKRKKSFCKGLKPSLRRR